MSEPWLIDQISYDALGSAMTGTDSPPSLSGSRADPEPEIVQVSQAIQPYGVLLVLSDPELVVQQVSANVADFLGFQPPVLLGQPLTSLLSPAAIAIRARFSQLNQLSLDQPSLDRGDRVQYVSFPIQQASQVFHATLYRRGGAIFLELEPAAGLADGQLQQFHPQLSAAIARLRQTLDRAEFLQLAAQELRQLTGFDRVMVYQFDAQGAGAVVAEAKQADLPSYLGLHYPATDIPEPVRVFYQRSMERYIPNLTACPVGLIPSKHPQTQEPTDLSASRLRSVDACCVEYHCNMGVAAILVLALTQGNHLWGLISCHHPLPKEVAPAVRESCEILAQLIAAELVSKVNTEELSYLTKLRSLQSDFVRSISQADDLTQALVQPAPRLLDLVGAQGAAICLENEMTLVGQTPTEEQVHGLLQWIESDLTASNPAATAGLLVAQNAPLFQTDSLPKLYPAAAAFKDTASGLLVLRISQVRRYTILWFRAEVLQTVDWAGDPTTSLAIAEDGQVTLCPRKSFARWQEIVQFTSLPWKDCELAAALDLRSAIVGIVLKKADELARINQELENSIRELDSFAYAASHDLKEPLRGIHNFSNLLLKGYAEVLDEVGQSRLQTLIRLTRRMESLIDALLKFSRLGQAELQLQPTDLNRLLHQVLTDLRVSQPELQIEFRLSRSLPTVPCDPVLMQEVLMNLLSNAVKYNDKPERWVEIGCLEQAVAGPQNESDADADFLPPMAPLYSIYVRDNGIGIRERHCNSVFRLFKRLHEQHLYGGGTGAGLTIAKKIIERHGGQIWVESEYGTGSTFYFTLRQF